MERALLELQAHCDKWRAAAERWGRNAILVKEMFEATVEELDDLHAAIPTPARLREMAEALEQAHQDDLDHPDGPLEIGLDDMAAELRALADKLEAK